MPWKSVNVVPEGEGMNIDQRRGAVHRLASRHVLLMVLMASLACSALLSAGCGKHEDEDPGVRTPVQDLLDWQRQALVAGAPAGASDQIHRFYTLRQDLRIPERRAHAEPELWRLLQQEPDNLLWLEAGLIRTRYLDHPARLDSLATARIAADSTGAVASFIKARRDWALGVGAEQGFFAALDSSAGLGAISRAWLELRCASVASSQGDQDQALARLQDALPRAWDAGGLAMATAVWYEVSRVALRLGWLDDSLAAARMALDCAERDGFEIGRIRGHLAISLAHEARAEYGPAWGQARAAATIARTGDHLRWQQDAARHFIYLLTIQADQQGALAEGRELFDMSLAMADTSSAIAAAFGLATSSSKEGDRHATAAWLATADALNTGRYRRLFDGRLAALRWRLAMEDGRYALADSLFESNTTSFGNTDRLGLLIESMEIGLEHGQPLLVEEALRRIRSDRSLLISDGGYDPRRDVTLLAAMFQARQGDFVAAYQEVQANADLIANGAPVQAHWANAYARGRIAVMEGDDHLAIGCFEEALGLADRMQNQLLAGRSRVRLGEALIRTGRPSEARALFDASLASPDYWSRLAARLVTGCALAAESRHQDALQHFQATAASLGHDGPLELRKRVALEAARSLLHLGRAEEALRRLEAVGGGVARDATIRESEVYHAFFRPLTLEWAELEIAAHLANAADKQDDRLALRTLAAAEAARWRLEPGGSAPTVQELAAVRIPPGAPVLALFEGPSRMYAWVGTHARWQVQEIRDPAAVASLIRRVSADTSSPTTTVDRAALAELGERLLRPVLSHWTTGEPLHLVAPGIFAAIPWPTLLLQDGAGQQHLAIDHGPLIHLAAIAPEPPRPLRNEDREHLLAVGHDDQGADGALRFAGREAEAIAERWTQGEAVTLVGPQAGWGSIAASGIERFGVVHIASHGIVRPDASSRPVLWLAGADDRRAIDSQAVRSLPLAADLVYLSCCEGSKLAQERGCGLDSLARAFLQAGARAVVASGSLVDDRAALAFALDFYALREAGQDDSEALRDIQANRAATTHPYYWANYQIHRAGLATHQSSPGSNGS